MKKIIFIVYDNTQIKDNPGKEVSRKDICKLIMLNADAATEEEESDFPVFTFRTDSYNQIDPEILNECLCPHNQIYVLIAGSQNLLPCQHNMLKDLGSPGKDPFAVKYSLTPQEMVIMDHLVKGLPYQRIADICCISYHTVKNHVSNIFTKLGVNKRSAAVYRFVIQRTGLN